MKRPNYNRMSKINGTGKPYSTVGKESCSTLYIIP
jgi:hypothetical protein